MPSREKQTYSNIGPGPTGTIGFRAGIEEHQRAGTEAFEPTDVVFAKAAPLVQAARVSEDMSAARSVDMEVNCLLANRTLGEKRVRSPPNQQLYELHNPHIEMSHG